MTCPTCGTEIAAEGETHTCIEAAYAVPPAAAGISPRGTTRSWEAMTWTVIGVLATYVVGCVAAVAFEIYQYVVVQDYLSHLADADLRRFDHIVSIAQVFAVAQVVLFTAYVIAYLTWMNRTRRAIFAARADHRVVLAHWSLRAWRIAIVVSLCLGFGVVTSESTIRDLAQIRVLGVLLALGVIRIAVAGFLIVAIWMVRPRIRALPPAAPRPPKQSPYKAELAEQWRSDRHF